MGQVQVFGTWGSRFSRRVEIALKMKGVEYEFIEEDLKNKSELLLQYNPIHKKIPVLVHDGKPVAESLVILEYIDQTWKNNPLLPTDPYERAQARFLAKFIDDMVMPSATAALMSKREESEKAIKDLDEHLKILETEIEGKKFFGGENIGFVDIAALIIAFWIPCLQEVVNKMLLTKEKYPFICTWADHVLASHVIKHNLPDKNKLQANYQVRYPNIRFKESLHL